MDTINYTALLVIIAGCLGHIWIKVLKPYFKAKLTTEEQANINFWTRMAVQAAEQIYKGAGRGAEKKAYVLQWLRDLGIEIDEAVLNAMVESLVYELKEKELL